MQIFRGFLPLIGEDGYAYLPWVLLSGGLTAVVTVQGVITKKINEYYTRALSGKNRAGRILVERTENASWNDRVRAYCRTHGLIIVRRNETDSNDAVSEEQL